MEPETYRVEIDEAICAGTSNCVEDAPDAYEIGPNGLARLKDSHLAASMLLVGAQACPVMAIRLFHPVTNQQVYP